jgi:hypothetical protein
VHVICTYRATDLRDCALLEFDIDTIDASHLKLDLVILEEIGPLPWCNLGHESNGERFQRERARCHEKRERCTESLRAVHASSQTNTGFTVCDLVGKRQADAARRRTCRYPPLPTAPVSEFNHVTDLGGRFRS